MGIKKLEKGLDTTESILNVASSLPVVNTITGASKALLGVIQAITGIAFAIFSTPFLFTAKGKVVFHNSVKHIIHGSVNVASGLVLALPIIGNVLAIKAWKDNHQHQWDYIDMGGYRGKDYVYPGGG